MPKQKKIEKRRKCPICKTDLERKEALLFDHPKYWCPKCMLPMYIEKVFVKEK